MVGVRIQINFYNRQGIFNVCERTEEVEVMGHTLEDVLDEETEEVGGDIMLTAFTLLDILPADIEAYDFYEVYVEEFEIVGSEKQADE